MKHIVAVFSIAAGALILIFSGAGWYADTTALPRYCDAPAATISRVGNILRDETPDELKSKRDYIVAAKLIFLVPQESNEPLTAYLGRLRARIENTCRVAL